MPLLCAASKRRHGTLWMVWWWLLLTWTSVEATSLRRRAENDNLRPPRAVALYDSLCRHHDSNIYDNTPKNQTCICHFLATLEGPASHQTSLRTDPSLECRDGTIEVDMMSYPCTGPVRLLSRISLTELSSRDSKTPPTVVELANDCWGWYASSGHEFVLVGLESATVVVDVTQPHNPTVVGRVATAGNEKATFWKDIKTYGNYAYMVAENGGSGLQVLEMTQWLRVNATEGPVDAEARMFDFADVSSGGGRRLSTAHNLFIHEATGFAYIVGSNLCGAGLVIVNLADNPAEPTWEACFDDDGYVHDVQCVLYHGADTRYTGREICFACNEDTVTIIDVTDKRDMVILSRTGYTDVAYTHQGWLNDDHNAFFFGDEYDEIIYGRRTRTLVLNVEDLEEPQIVGEYFGPEAAIDHNMYIRDKYLYQSNYASGLQVYEIGDNIAMAADNLTLAAQFDTYPSSSSARFVGAWSSYIYFPSGNIAVSDINQGLFMVHVNLTRHGDDASPTASAAPSTAPSVAPSAAPSDSVTGACPRTDACTRRFNNANAEGYYLHRQVFFRCVTRCVSERSVPRRLGGRWECGKC